MEGGNSKLLFLFPKLYTGIVLIENRGRMEGGPWASSSLPPEVTAYLVLSKGEAESGLPPGPSLQGLENFAAALEPPAPQLP